MELADIVVFALIWLSGLMAGIAARMLWTAWQWRRADLMVDQLLDPDVCGL